MTDPIRRHKSPSQSSPLPKTVGDIRHAAARGAKLEEAGAKTGKVLYGQPPAAPSSLGPTRPSRDASGFLAGLLQAQGGSKNPLVQAAIAAMQQRNHEKRLAEHEAGKQSIQFVEYPKDAAPPSVSIQERIARGELVLRDPVPPRTRQPVKRD